MPTAAGHHVRAAFDWEDVASFGTGTLSTTANPKAFGANTTFDTLEGSHQAVRVFDPNSRKAARIIEQAFDGAFTVNFDVTNPWAIGGAIDASPSSSGTAPSTHTWRVDSFGAGYPKPMIIYEGLDIGSNSFERQFHGAVPTTLNISTDVGGNAVATIDGAYATESQAGTLTGTVSTSYRPFHFGHVDVTYDVNNDEAGSTTRRRVQNLTITAEQNVDMVQELGDRFPVDFSPKAFSPTLDYARLVDNSQNPDDEMERFYGSASSAPDSPQTNITNSVRYDVNFDNNQTGTDNSMTFINAGSIPNTFSHSGAGDQSADLEQELQEMVENVRLQATISSTLQ